MVLGSRRDHSQNCALLKVPHTDVTQQPMPHGAWASPYLVLLEVAWLFPVVRLFGSAWLFAVARSFRAAWLFAITSLPGVAWVFGFASVATVSFWAPRILSLSRFGPKKLILRSFEAWARFWGRRISLGSKDSNLSSAGPEKLISNSFEDWARFWGRRFPLCSKGFNLARLGPKKLISNPFQDRDGHQFCWQTGPTFKEASLWSRRGRRRGAECSPKWRPTSKDTYF